jgi:AhpD family alkylhydroperoxidase
LQRTGNETAIPRSYIGAERLGSSPEKRPEQEPGREEGAMSRQDVHNEMEQMFGTVISFVDQIPDDFIDAEWDLIKRVQFGETLIPNKYKELMGLAIAAVTRCRYCSLFHTEAAKLFGATAAEVEEAVHYAKLVSGWSVYLNGLQVDYESFADEVRRVVGYVTSQAAA